MKFATIITLIAFFSSLANASKCGAPVLIENKSDKLVKFEICLKYVDSDIALCDRPIVFGLKGGERTKMLLPYMCGYENDPELSDYWVVYRSLEGATYESIRPGSKVIFGK